MGPPRRRARRNSNFLITPSRNPLARLGHIQSEIAELTRALDGVTFSAFAANYVLRRTAEHALLIISEAVKALSPDVTDRYDGVDWRAVRSIGNVLRHDYYEVDTKVLWKVVTERLPELRPVIERMIADQSE